MSSLPSPDPGGFTPAMQELEGILRALESETVDLDELGARVRRAGELIRFCRDRITQTRLEVDEIVGDLEGDTGDETR